MCCRASKYNQITIAYFEPALLMGRFFDGHSMVGRAVYVTAISGAATQWPENILCAHTLL